MAAGPGNSIDLWDAQAGKEEDVVEKPLRSLKEKDRGHSDVVLALACPRFREMG